MMTSAERVHELATVAHTAFTDHVRVCSHCRRAYPWCPRGQTLEGLADRYGDRSMAMTLIAAEVI